MQNLFYILRGISGSGKSSIARELKLQFPNAVVCSADDHFIQPDGSWEFKPWEIGIAHQKCQNKCFDALANKVEVVIIDNTNTQQWEFENYIQQAKHFGYRVIIMEKCCRDENHARRFAARNQHGVPEEVVLGMYNRWETAPEGVQVLRIFEDLKLEAA